MAEAEDEAAGVGQSDAVLLEPLTEDSFLHNLHVRYKRDVVYTWVGNALVSVNPCRALPLYSAELVRAYLARPPHQLPPHLYALTASAYRWVRDRGESQCIVMTGESGAGKTEAARVCLQCAVLAAGPAPAPPAPPAARLAAAGTLLEAFGHAATARNHNASRFGKLLEIEFDFKGEPVGGHITHYLLEKERAYSVPEGERNFHVLYQLLAGADVQLLKRLKLQRSWEQYRILRAQTESRGCASPRRTPPASPAPAPAAARDPRRAAQHDVDHFAFTKEAMATLGFSGAECGAVLRLLAFMLKLGNVRFEPQHNIDGSIGTRIHRAHEVSEACALVGVEGGALAEALTAAAHPPQLPDDAAEESDSEAEGAGGGSGWARAALDRLLGTLYARLFTWLVRRANAALEGGGGRAALALLDVYGFERLARNGLERLLINYAAERVQAAVAGAALRREQEDYVREGLAWRALPHPDHELLAELLDAGPASVLAALAAPAAPAALLRRLPPHPRLRPDPPHHFTVVHFGGAVRYDARGMAAHNRDALCARCGGVLAAAREPLLAELFAGGGSPRRPQALAARQRALVLALVRRLPPAPRLVRCLRPDAALRAQRWDAALVRAQLRSQAVLEMAQLRRAGWCDSLCARDALRRYAVLAPRPSPRPPAGPPPEPVRALRALLRALPIPSAEFAFGRTRVFLRSPRTVWELEALRAARVSALVAGAQRAWRAHPGAAGAHGRAAAPPAPRVALPRVPRAAGPDGAQPHAREGHLLRAVPGPQGAVRAQRGAPLRGRLRAAARLGRVAARRARRRPLRGVRGRVRQGGARLGPRGARARRRVHGGAAAAGGALAARAPPRARARRVAPVAVAAGGRRAGGARAPARRRRRRARARLPARRRAPPRRRGAAHLPRARAGHQAVPRRAERRGHAAAGAHRDRVRGELRRAGGDAGVPRAGRGRRRAPAAPPGPHGRAAVAAPSHSHSHSSLRDRYLASPATLV